LFANQVGGVAALYVLNDPSRKEANLSSLAHRNVEGCSVFIQCSCFAIGDEAVFLIPAVFFDANPNENAANSPSYRYVFERMQELYLLQMQP